MSKSPALSAEVYAAMRAADPELPSPDLVNSATIRLEANSAAMVEVVLFLSPDAANAMARTLTPGGAS